MSFVTMSLGSHVASVNQALGLMLHAKFF